MFASDHGYHTNVFSNPAVFRSYVMSPTDAFLATFANRDSEFAESALTFPFPSNTVLAKRAKALEILSPKGLKVKALRNSKKNWPVQRLCGSTSEMAKIFPDVC